MPSVIEELPKSLANWEFISRGATSWVYKVDKDLVLKVPRLQAIQAFKDEGTVYEELEKREPCPHLLQSIFRCPGLYFLPFLSGGSLDDRFRGNQSRGSDGSIDVLRTTSQKQAEQWAMQLAGGMAWLESLGFVHGDLRPANVLLDGADHIKLADFDSVSKIGSVFFGSAPPWARVQGDEAGPDKGTFGTQGPRTEQFAFASILYTITRGFEPYEKERDSAKVLDWLQDMEFPELGESATDCIIDRCWKGRFASIQLLFQETALLEGATALPQSTALEAKHMAVLQGRCQRLLGGELKQVVQEFGTE
ncbi:hypothetical protein G6O67_000467 [Ophiocordyceps sinensis]|uniref:EKC/KEOPS complex subunit BUD32 n=2 Tax=Ophiocordyceps sinensis TaxID=72228 RepID=A0A8H4PZ30_9HYPO|nr:serine/threonine protein kinase [Ophiocordyceps sinensis CO18]KAF4513161.1 hypothetical protein G6O67_000467 [Ophiocordyceps sinensis]